MNILQPSFGCSVALRRKEEGSYPDAFQTYFVSSEAKLSQPAAATYVCEPIVLATNYLRLLCYLVIFFYYFPSSVNILIPVTFSERKNLVLLCCTVTCS